jgi:hypothetical protein
MVPETLLASADEVIQQLGRCLGWVMSVGGHQGCLAVNVRSTPNSDRKFKDLASVAKGQDETFFGFELAIHFTRVAPWASRWHEYFQ